MLLTRICTLLSLLFIWIGLMGISSTTTSFLFIASAVSFTYSVSYLFKTTYQKINFNYLVIPYFFWLTKEIVKSSISVSKIIWSRKLDLKPALAWVEFDAKEGCHSKAGRALLHEEEEIGVVAPSTSSTRRRGSSKNIDLDSGRLLRNFRNDASRDFSASSGNDVGQVCATKLTDLVEDGLVLYGNSITLTPGTITLDIKDGMLLVHALDESGIEDLKQGEMSNRIVKCMRCQ